MRNLYNIIKVYKVKRCVVSMSMLLLSVVTMAQVGSHRDQFTVGVHGGVNLSNVSFLPKVNQSMLQSKVGGLVVRYTCEKYFSTICAIQAEVNYSQIGWKEDILDADDVPVPSLGDGNPEFYKRTMNYIQVPLLAHLAWGKEERGLRFFFNAGPQVGFFLNDKVSTNFTPKTANFDKRVNDIVAQDTMAVENKFDYGIAAGAGVELHIKHVGRFQLEGRYYYGLGNIYGDSKRDYFAQSSHGVITIRAAYLLDL